MASQTSPRHKGLAIASLVLGVLSIPSLGLIFVGAIVGLVLGVIALKRANNSPQEYGGRGLAITGIITNSVALVGSVILGIILAITLPSNVRARQAANEATAINIVRNITSAELTYAAMKGQGKYTDLRTLAADGLISPPMALERQSGYSFTVEVYNQGENAMFDVTARPLKLSIFGSATRSFYSNEKGVIYEGTTATPPVATPQDRVPKDGKPIS